MIDKIKGICFILLWLIVPLNTFAFDFEIDGIAYNKLLNSTNEVEVTKYTNKYGTNTYSGDIVVPSEISYLGITYQVTAIGEGAFYNCGHNIQSVSLSNNIKTIGNNSFKGLWDIKSITLPSSVISIGNNAFNDCQSLESIVIPNNVTTIGDEAFDYCLKLQTVTLGNSIKEIGNSAFSRCSMLKSINIPNSVESIGGGAFSSCTILPSIDIPNSVKIIGKGVFAECTNLKNVTLSQNITEIAVQLFYNCNSLEAIVIPNSVKIIGDMAFSGCKKLVTFINSNSLESIGRLAFNDCYCLSSITFPYTLKAIGSQAFYGCPSLSLVVSEITDPFQIEDNRFFYVQPGLGITTQEKTLKIPGGTKQKYIDKGWTGHFNNVIEETVYYELFINSLGKGIVTYGTNQICESSLNQDVEEGSSVTITFSPNNGYRVKSVKVNNIDVSSSVSNNQYTLNNISTNTTIEVIFEAIPIPTYTLSVKASGNGSATYDGTTAKNNTKTFTLNEGASATITFTPDNGYRIKSVKVNSADVTSKVSSNSYTISSINTNTIVEVDFEIIPKNSYILVYIVDGTTYKTYQIEEGATITPEAKPTKEGYTFSGWSDIPTTMPAKDVTITGSFTLNKYRLTYQVDGKEYKSFNIEYGTTITLEAEPTKEGYTFSGWSEIPKTMPAKDVTVTGAFTVNKYNLTYQVDGKEYKSYSIEYGTTITPEAEPTKEGYTFSGWSEIPKTMPAIDVTVTGTFTKNEPVINTYTLTITAIGNGSASYGGTKAKNDTKSFTLNEGASATIIFTPDNGRRIKSVKVNNTDVTSSVSNNQYTVNNINTNTTVEVEFEAIPPTTYTLSFTTSDHGTTSYNGTTTTNGTKYTVNEGANVTISFIPSDGYQIKSVKVNGTDVTSSVINNQYTISNISSNNTVEVEFDLIPMVITTYTLSIKAVGSGSATFNNITTKNDTKSFTLNEGTSAIITFNPDESYQIKSVKVNNSDVTSNVSNNHYLISSISTNITVEVEFEAIPEPEPTPVENFNVDGINYHVSAAGIIQVTSADQGVKNIVIPQKVSYEGTSYTVTSIADKAFERNTAITNVQIPNSVTEIGKNAFGACSNLSSITLPNSVTEIGDAAFYGCSSLSSVSLPNGLKQIGESLFWGCTGLTSVTIPGNVTSIGEEAFLECQNLESVVSEIEKPFNIPNNVFEGISSTAILTVPTETKYTYEQSSGWTMHFAKIKEMGVPDSYTLTISAVGSGVIAYDDVSIRNSSRSFDVETGVSATITYKADEGYQIKSITVNDRVIQTDKNQYVIDIMDEDLTIAVEFEAIPINTYTLKYVVDDETYMSYLIEEGAAVTHEADPTKEGYTFSGWSETPTTMPAHDVTVIGSFTVNKYTLTYQVDGEEYKTYKIEYGTALTPEAEPTKESYTFSGWSEIPSTMPAHDVTVIGTFTMKKPDINDLEKTFVIEGINYEVVSTDNQTVVVATGDYGQILEVPATITYGNYTWGVIGLKDGALDNCKELAAVIWNPTIAFNARVSNPNLLLYVKDEAYKSLGVKNVVVNGTAESIELTDAANGNDFYCPKAFTTKNISYSHYYNMETGLGDSKGWETIVLPFDVQKYTSRKGEIVPFTKWTESSSTKPFWLFELTASGYHEVDGIKANTPYIISMPNNPQYLADYVITGIVTFSAENVEVKASDDMQSAHYHDRTFVPNFINLNDNNCFALNVNNYYVTNSSTDKDGSKFIKGLRSIHPFEAYMTSTSNTRSIDVLDGMTTAIKEIMVTTESTDIIKVYDTKGVLLKTTKGNDNPKIGLKAGVYIVNGNKMIIK